MFDSAMAFERYRLEVIRHWPDNEIKDIVRASIEVSMKAQGTGETTEDLWTGRADMANCVK